MAQLVWDQFLSICVHTTSYVAVLLWHYNEKLGGAKIARTRRSASWRTSCP